MEKKDLYDYIDSRLLQLSYEEAEAISKSDYNLVHRCIAKKIELLDMKLFIQSKSL